MYISICWKCELNEDLRGAMTTARSSAAGRGPRKTPSKESAIADFLTLIRASTLFTGISRQSCLKIACCARLRTFVRDELLFSKGQPDDCLIMIRTGKVKLTQCGSGVSEVVLRMAGSGDPVCVGDFSSARSHTCSARAKEHGSALIWDYKQLQILIAEFPVIGRNISLILSRQLTELEERFRELATERVSNRVAFALLRLAGQIGKPRDGGIEISITPEELAQLANSSAPAVSQTISQWAGIGLLLARREGLVLLDIDLLGRMRSGNETGSAVASAKTTLH